MKVLINGIAGHMGQYVENLVLANKEEFELVGGIDSFGDSKNVKTFKDFNDVNVDFDMVIDFSHHSLTRPLLNFCMAKNKPLVLCTTAQDEDEKTLIKTASKNIPIFFSANMSLGVAVLCSLAKKTAEQFKDADIEIVEIHHNRKIDAPSGTALMLANSIKEVRPNANFVLGRNGNQKREKQDIGINSIRMGNIVGIHEVHVCTNTQSITLKHEAYTRELFAEGALDAARFLINKGPGLYNMDDMVK